MSAQEIHTLAQQFVDAFNKKDLKAALNILSDDLEVFDHVPYRFDNKEQFATFLAGAVEGIASMNFGFRQPSCRVFNDNTGIVNAYDTFTGVTKDGKVQTIHGFCTRVLRSEMRNGMKPASLGSRPNTASMRGAYPSMSGVMTMTSWGSRVGSTSNEASS